MRFCEHNGCNQPVFGTCKQSRKGYCKSHQTDRLDFNRKSITQRAIERHNANPSKQISKEPRFQSPKKIHKGTFNVGVLNSEIVPVTPTPESFDGKGFERYTMDEMGVTGSCGIDESLVNLSNDLDFVLSQYIRYKNADKDGNCTCFTCGVVLPIKKMQNGHYKKRTHKATRFLEQNCRCQCEKCNNLHNTDETPYKNALEAEYAGITDWLDEQAAMVYKATRDELKQALIEYRGKLEMLKRKYEKT